MAMKYIVDLNKYERAELVVLIQKDHPDARKIKRAKAQSQPPNGRVCWTLQLLAERLVALTRLESCSGEAIRLMESVRLRVKDLDFEYRSRTGWA